MYQKFTLVYISVSSFWKYFLSVILFSLFLDNPNDSNESNNIRTSVLYISPTLSLNPGESFVNLKFFDSLGNEITQILNKQRGFKMKGMFFKFFR
mgnify:CR=1 FL=1